MTAFNSLLISLPTGNSTLRMRVWRALKNTGGGVLRDGVYVFPLEGRHGSVLDGVETQIKAAGGFAMTVELNLKTPEQLAHVRKLFDRSNEYAALVASTTAALARLKRLGKRKTETLVQRLRRSFDEIAEIDYYPGQAQLQAKDAVSTLEREAERLFSDGEPHAAKRRIRTLDRARYRNRTWATRKDLWIDRIACVWLIKRFIDSKARFVWIDGPRGRPKGSIGFDFDGAEFTHVENRVTFEVLLTSFGLAGDPSLAALAQAVHFLDIGGIPVGDAKGLETIIRGIKAKGPSDDDLAKEASKVLDYFYSASRSA